MLPIMIKHNIFRNLDYSDFLRQSEKVFPSVHLMEDRGIRESKISYFQENKKINFLILNSLGICKL